MQEEEAAFIKVVPGFTEFSSVDKEHLPIILGSVKNPLFEYKSVTEVPNMYLSNIVLLNAIPCLVQTS